MVDVPMPQVLGLYETHLTVVDLDRSIRFYRDVIGLELATVIENRNVAFFWIDDKREGMLGLWAIGSAPLRMRLHIAFRVTLEDVLGSAAALKAHGVQPLDLNDNPSDEPVVLGWMPAVSQYFLDPDGHSIEYIHVLEDASDPGFGVKPYSQWLSRPKPTI
ncbi:VOC family protein [Rhizobium rhizogenes]|uniref:Lactoylglutathione lyase protein n=1 Tax=Rhizobium rhizogenes (strain K84 / ATCC BAA-868) TaxID=311403 RepID=B9J8S6_RHIR8|nr:VOC family protein [Rhizobium rhizogenes]ACM27464.1 lactoylglutathione lyase protein [Rhizobium rhizogenes K84]OCJ13565.1 glyoxalase [Agrobacterium sp. B131/95]MDJ1638458.1 VOC family protein [Rhizobium rhizogenes]NTF82064.1 VOC family protein [Rhizobium rhizogenes]NTG74640.1 VOC family protein [Rhizobium rhizogenes]